MKKRFVAAFSVAITLIALCAFVGQFGAVSSQTSTLLNEGFEAGGKSAYAAANVTLGSGSWYLDDALTGNTTSDRKTGSWSARVRELGKVRMNFNVASAGTVTIQHAKYGSDGDEHLGALEIDEQRLDVDESRLDRDDEFDQLSTASLCGQ